MPTPASDGRPLFSMSIHAISPEIEAAMRRQRRISSITSAIIAFLAVVLLMLLLSFFLLSPLFKESPTIVTYESNTPDNSNLEVKKVSTRFDQKPSSPSSSMARVIAAATQSAAVSVPVPDEEVTVPSLDFGSGDDFGQGWSDESGSGGGASFFQQKVSAERVVYVIDYSLSMTGDREKLMRKELKKSVTGLSPGMKYQLIFFAGPAWVAGDKVTLNGRKSAVVEANGHEYEWKCGGNATDWQPKGRKREVEWLEVATAQSKKSVDLIGETKLVWGTIWEPPLEMAIAMDPPPQMIFFMTDGVTGGDAVSVAKSIAARAKAKNITINTVAMMEPKAGDAMKELAKRTGGQFSMIDKSGKVHKGN